MKKIVMTFILLFLITQATALTITTPETVDQGSTTIFTLQGNILDPITKSDVGFFENHVQIPFDYNIEKIEGTYYIYALIPYQEKNYSLRISDVYFKENNQFKTLDLEANFTVSPNVAEFNVNPGFIITSQDNFEISLYNNLNSNLLITYAIGEIQKQKTLPLQETTKLTLDLKDLDVTALNNLIISSANLQYSMPVYTIREEFGEPIIIQPEVDDEGNIIIPEIVLEGTNLQFTADAIDEILITGEVREITLGLDNLGDISSGEINFEVSEEIEDLIDLEIVSISNIEPGEVVEIKFSINAERSGEFRGGIKAISQDSFDELDIILLIGTDVEPTTSVRSEITCGELNGEVCLASQICSGITLPSAGNIPCCTEGSCSSGNEPPIKKEGLNTVSVVLIALALLIILIVIGLKLKKKKPKRKESARFDPPAQRTLRRPPLPPPDSVIPEKKFPARNVQIS